MPGRPITEAEFWDLVEVTDECWLWIGTLYPNGYGRRGNHYAHVLAWEFTNMTAKPEGYDLHHQCYVKNCVRPDHLELLTISEHRGLELRARTHCREGHPYDEENTYFYTNYAGKSGRQCRRCNAAHARRRRAEANGA